MISKRFLGILSLLALATVPALAKPDFSGNWKLNASKSTLGQMPAPDSMTYKVKQEDNKLTSDSKQSSQMGDFDQHAVYTLDGKESSNEGFGGGAMKSTAKWDGDTLVVESKGTFGDNEMTISAKWSLSADGKTLTIDQTIKSPMGDMQMKQVFDKQ